MHTCRVWRITAARFADNVLSGLGAAQSGGRWNSRGKAVAYAADSAALAMLEMLVHIDRSDVPLGMRLLAFEIPEDGIVELHPLPHGWRRFPYSPLVQAAGDAWAGSRSSLALRVPSVVARGHSNILVNPAHGRFGEIHRSINEPLDLDGRLFAS